MQLNLKIRSALDRTAVAMKTYYRHIIAAALAARLILIVYGHDLQILFNEAVQNQALSHELSDNDWMSKVTELSCGDGGVTFKVTRIKK